MARSVRRSPKRTHFASKPIARPRPGRPNFATKSVARPQRGRPNFATKSVGRKKVILPKAKGPCKHIYKYVGYTVPRLKKLAKENNLKRYSTLKKADLIQLIGEYKRNQRNRRRRRH